MKTVFDVISTLSVPDIDIVPFLGKISELLQTSDFDSRTGRKMYVNWVDRCCTDGTLNTVVAQDPNAFQIWFVNLSTQSRLLDLAQDFLVRRRNLLFVQRVLELYGRDILGYADAIPDIFFKLITSVSPAEGSIDRLRFSNCLLRIGLTLPFIKSPKGENTIRELLNHHRDSLSNLSRGTERLLAALLHRKDNPCVKSPESSATSEYDFSRMIDFVPLDIQCRYGLVNRSSVKSRRAPRQPFAVDMYFLLSYLLSQPGCDFGVIKKVIKDILSLSAPIAEFYANYSITVLWVESPGMRSQICHLITKGLVEGETREFFRAYLEYVILQSRFGLDYSDMIRELRQDFLDSPESGEILSYLNELKCLKTSFEFPVDALADKIQSHLTRMKKEEKTSHAKRKLPQLSSESELDKLISVLKSKPAR
jgi:hypothetical protein